MYYNLPIVVKSAYKICSSYVVNSRNNYKVVIHVDVHVSM